MFERLRRALKGCPALELRVRELRTLLLLTIGQLTALVTMRDGKIAQLFTNTA